MKILWISMLILGFTGNIFAAQATQKSPEACGLYEIRGVVQVVNQKPVLKLYKGSMSEQQLEMDLDLQAGIRPYYDKSVKVRAFIKGPIVNQRGKIYSSRAVAKNSEIQSLFNRKDISERFEDPRKSDEGYLLIQKTNCK